MALFCRIHLYEYMRVRRFEPLRAFYLTYFGLSYSHALHPMAVKHHANGMKRWRSHHNILFCCVSVQLFKSAFWGRSEPSAWVLDQLNIVSLRQSAWLHLRFILRPRADRVKNLFTSECTSFNQSANAAAADIAFVWLSSPKVSRMICWWCVGL